MDGPGRPGPGFAPAAGERGMVAWQGVAVCGTALMALSVLLTSVALAVVLVLEAGAAAGRDPVVSGTTSAGLDRRVETVISRMTDLEGTYLPGLARTSRRGP